MGGEWLSVLENESLGDNNGIPRDDLMEILNPNSRCDSFSHYKNLVVVVCDHPSVSVRVGNNLMGMRSGGNAETGAGVTGFCCSCSWSVPAQQCALEVL